MLSNSLDALRRIKRDSLYYLEDTIRTFRQSLPASSSEIVNQKAIRVIGLKRSGNHAIVNWIRKQMDEEVWYLNNLPPQRNPYRFLSEHYPGEKWQKEAKGDFTPKKCLMYSYENCELSEIVAPSFQQKHELYFGKTATQYDVLILRDPFNMFASMLHNHRKQIKQHGEIINSYFNGKNRRGKCQKSAENTINLWIDYAKESLGETSFLSDRKVIIHYNFWFADRDYRSKIAEKLDIPFSDRGKNEVKNFGGGSSFEGLQLDGTAAQMDVLTRWKTLSDDREYRALFHQNPELIRYSEKIFGRIPDTEKLLE